MISLSSFLGAELPYVREQFGLMVEFSQGKRSVAGLEYKLLDLLRESIPLTMAMNELWASVQEAA